MPETDLRKTKKPFTVNAVKQYDMDGNKVIVWLITFTEPNTRFVANTDKNGTQSILISRVEVKNDA